MLIDDTVVLSTSGKVFKRKQVDANLPPGDNHKVRLVEDQHTPVKRNERQRLPGSPVDSHECAMFQLLRPRCGTGSEGPLRLAVKISTETGLPFGDLA